MPDRRIDSDTRAILAGDWTPQKKDTDPSYSKAASPFHTIGRQSAAPEPVAGDLAMPDRPGGLQVMTLHARPGGIKATLPLGRKPVTGPRAQVRTTGPW